MSNIKSQASWTMATSIVAAITHTLQLVILARLVSPAEIGVLAIANIFIVLILVFQDMGLSSYLIHRQQSTKEQHSALLLVSLTIGIVLTAIMLCSAPYIADFYQEQELSSLLSLASFNFVLIGAASLFHASLIRSFKQALLAKIEIIARVLAFIFTVSYLLFVDANIIAVIYGTIVNAVVKLALLIVMRGKSFEIALKPDLSIVGPACRYGLYSVGSQSINQLRTQADQIILGKLLGVEALGFYSLAKELILKPVRFISPLISRLVLPRLAAHQSDDQKTQDIQTQTVRILAWSNCLVYGGIALLAYPIILLLYGEQYLPSALLLAAMSLYGMVRPLGGVFSAVAQSRGRSNTEFGWNVIAGVIMTLTMTIAASTSSLIIVAVTLSIVGVALTILCGVYFSLSLKLNSHIDFIKTVSLPIFVSSLITALGCYIIYNV